VAAAAAAPGAMGASGAGGAGAATRLTDAPTAFGAETPWLAGWLRCNLFQGCSAGGRQAAPAPRVFMTPSGGGAPSARGIVTAALVPWFPVTRFAPLEFLCRSRVTPRCSISRTCFRPTQCLVWPRPSPVDFSLKTPNRAAIQALNRPGPALSHSSAPTLPLTSN
jgi:hypothetical protein